MWMSPLVTLNAAQPKCATLEWTHPQHQQGMDSQPLAVHLFSLSPLQSTLVSSARVHIVQVCVSQPCLCLELLNEQFSVISIFMIAYQKLKSGFALFGIFFNTFLKQF